MLELIDIKKRYGSKEVLHGISIKFENGIYGLIGTKMEICGKFYYYEYNVRCFGYEFRQNFIIMGN